jgi:hypothetical protein
VRIAAILVGLASLPVVILWVVGSLEVLAGDGESLGEALPSVLLAVITGLATSGIVLRMFELSGRGFWHRYRVAATAVCLGGVIMGALLAVLYAADGTLGADPSSGELLAEPLAVLFALPAGFVDAASCPRPDLPRALDTTSRRSEGFGEL